MLSQRQIAHAKKNKKQVLILAVLLVEDRETRRVNFLISGTRKRHRLLREEEEGDREGHLSRCWASDEQEEE
tara:strand:- start:315 stop:530 length:216 start_codon:yes stop_codon:yes gene_type:complete